MTSAITLRSFNKVVFNCLLLLAFSFTSLAQNIPSERIVNWSQAGFRGDIPSPDLEINIMDFGAIADGIADNSAAFQSALEALNNEAGVILFPAGNYLFNSRIDLNSGVVLRGDGSNNTTLTFDLGGVDDLINIKGSATNLLSNFTESGLKGQTTISIADPSILSSGDYVRISQVDTSLVFSSWAIGTVGQVVKINEINGNQLLLDSELRKDFLIDDSPQIELLNMVTNTGVECLKITRLDETNPIQTNSIKYIYAAQSWVSGVESENANFAHVTIQTSSNITITGCYFHDAFDYGGGGRAYGVMVQQTGNESLIENNVFEHLRHAMIVQSGANGNVFAYNYSREPFWTGTSFPDDATGDMVCHGNFAYTNLFEGNIGQQIVIDNSHGMNGPNNTFLRNRAGLYGIFMSFTNSPNQNFIGNEITAGPADSLGFYFLQGVDHFEFGNNQRGDIIPEGTTDLTLNSLYLTDADPDFFMGLPFPSIGLPNTINTGTLPAENRWILSEQITACASDCIDSDDDTVCDLEDNCPTVFNKNQNDKDGDGVGNKCDNCKKDANTDQADSDGDNVGDVCDRCPDFDDAINADNDKWPDACDNCPLVKNNGQNDNDGDGVGNKCDNCKKEYNPGQEDSDNDGIGDACDLNGLSSNNNGATYPSEEETINTAAFDLFPNPVDDYLYIDLKKFAGKKATILIQSTYGKIIDKEMIQRLPKEDIMLDMNDYTNGVYFISVQIENQRRFSKVFTVMRNY